MIERQPGERAGEYRLVLRPNASLDPRQAGLLVGSLGLMMTAIGLGFTAMGAWPVLPFSGGELLLLVWALGCSMRRNSVREVITIGEKEIRIDHQEPDGECRHEFPRAWFRIDWRPAPTPKLMIGSYGKWVEVGAFLGEEEKRVLAKALQQARMLEY